MPLVYNGGVYMLNTKKSLCLISLGLLGAITISVAALNSHNISSLAGGITSNGNNRTLVLDKDTPLSINGEAGSLNIGPLSIYSPSCESLENGVAKLKNGKIIVYCPGAPLVSGYYQGFSGSTISSITINFKDCGTSKTLRVCRGRIKASDMSLEWTGTSSLNFSSTTTAGSEDIQELNISNEENSNFINYPKSGYSCVYINNSANGQIDLYSLTISFTCSAA